MLLLDITNVVDWKFGFADPGNEQKQIDRLSGVLQKNKFAIATFNPLNKHPVDLPS